ncbi:MAG: stage III sporulation protein AB [Tyzzerella sp.]|nr:stage III sporulation protein AB [Tyzzerella sp.]
MQKLIGCVLVFFACSGMGICKGLELKSHLKELEELKQLFVLLKSELQYTRAPFAEVFRKIGKKTQGELGAWITGLCKSLEEKGTGTFYEIWCDSIEQALGNTYLKKEEKEELKNLGKNLEYIESIGLYIEQLEYNIKNTREEYQTKRKLCQSMGIMGGIFLVILLL